MTETLKDQAVKIKLVDRRLRISNNGLYWGYKNEEGRGVIDLYPLDQYSETLRQSGFRCESVNRVSGSKSLDLVQKTLRINKEGFYWDYEECKKVLIFRFKCEMKTEAYPIKDWGDKLAQMGFFCFRWSL